ncbi:MAG: hypothetical protein P4N41_18155 [Negativicutes bacterium]|nr:hypothetical protein [Negativicutes bacterium]
MTGPVSITLGGKERFLRYDINSAAEMEELMGGRSLLYIMANPTVGGIAPMRIMLWGGMKHAEKGLTLQRVGILMQEYMENGGELNDLAEKIGEAVRKSKILGNLDEGKTGDEGNG